MHGISPFSCSIIEHCTRWNCSHLTWSPFISDHFCSKTSAAMGFSWTMLLRYVRSSLIVCSMSGFVTNLMAQQRQTNTQHWPQLTLITFLATWIKLKAKQAWPHFSSVFFMFLSFCLSTFVSNYNVFWYHDFVFFPLCLSALSSLCLVYFVSFCFLYFSFHFLFAKVLSC